MSDDSVAASQLKAYVERAERLNGEKTAINQDLSELFKEMKGNGFDTKVVKALISDRAKDPSKKSEFDALYEIYAVALGMQPEAYRDEELDEPRAPARAHVENIGEFPVEHDEDGVFPDDEPQSAPTARDLTAGHTPTWSLIPADAGQVAPIQPETANDTQATTPLPEDQGQRAAASIAQEHRPAEENGLVEEASEPEASGGVQDECAIHPATLYAEPGVIVMETVPPVGIVAHPFAACWPVNNIDVTGGVREPIVKVGNLIVDGRGRYFAARAAMIEYPVVQYSGDDLLMDTIQWNLRSRSMSPQARGLVMGKLQKMAPEREGEIEDLFMAISAERQAAE